MVCCGVTLQTQSPVLKVPGLVPELEVLVPLHLHQVSHTPTPTIISTETH